MTPQWRRSWTSMTEKGYLHVHSSDVKINSLIRIMVIDLQHVLSPYLWVKRSPGGIILWDKENEAIVWKDQNRNMMIYENTSGFAMHSFIHSFIHVDNFNGGWWWETETVVIEKCHILIKLHHESSCQELQDRKGLYMLVRVQLQVYCCPIVKQWTSSL